MKFAILLSALLLASNAWAAGPKTHLMDHSNDMLIDEAAAKAVMTENIPAKVWKLYKANRYVFSSQVEGGMRGDTCIVTARVMMLPLSPTIKKVLFEPIKTATAFDAQSGATVESCKGLARDKLKEATLGVVSSLVRN